MTSTASYILDSDTYVKQGAFNDDSQAWADRFKALGGESCGIRASWFYDTDGPVMEVVGTPEALAFVEATVAG